MTNKECLEIIKELNKEIEEKDRFIENLKGNIEFQKNCKNEYLEKTIKLKKTINALVHTITMLYNKEV